MHSRFATAPHFTVIGSCFVVIALVTKAADTHAPDSRFRLFVVLYTVNADIIVGPIPTSRDISVQIIPPVIQAPAFEINLEVPRVLFRAFAAKAAVHDELCWKRIGARVARRAGVSVAMLSK